MTTKWNFFVSEIEETVNYLNSAIAFESVADDPYWPKWDTPWWRVMTLFELGEIKQVPDKIIDKLIESMDSTYIHFFPFYEKDIPKDCDVYRQIPCHCALGCIYQALFAYGIDVDERLPWLRPWFLKYQLADGGFNCDEQAYTNSLKSSMVSTLPPLEAILYCTEKLTKDEEKLVDKGAQYIINHRLVYTTSTQQLMSPSFMKLSFPRFYDYDFLRGLLYLVRWQKIRQKDYGSDVIALGKKLLKNKGKVSSLPISDDVSSLNCNDCLCVDTIKLILEKHSYDDSDTLTFDGGKWTWKSPEIFPLLEEVSKIGNCSYSLLRIYEEIMD